MKYLLDVNLLLAVIWSNHPQHPRAFAWMAGKTVSVCPLTELGFLRISTQPKAINAPMDKSRELLKKFVEERRAGWIADDLPSLKSSPKKSEAVTDSYLATLADKHGLRLATLDTGIKHAAVELVS